MNIIDKMERKFGHVGIPHLIKYVLLLSIVGNVLNLIRPGIYSDFLSFDMYQILHGQIWRLVSWLLVPPSSLNIFTIIMLFFYYSIGNSLEQTWGTFRYNVYIFGGILWTIIGAFVLYGIMYVMYGGPVAFGAFGMAFSTY